jgi:hypothetical protein
MPLPVPYSARKQDLFTPAISLDPFPKGRPKTDAELCAWMAWLSYRDQGKNFAFERVEMESKLRAIGFQTVSFFESANLAKKGGTHCFLALHEEPARKNNLAVVAFRGTNASDIRDLLDDAKLWLVDWNGKSKVFDGFKKALAEVAPALDEALARIQPDCKLLFTGHSLGAAMATLLASKKAPTALYTIGSPRVGDKEFVLSLGAVKCYRYVDCCDVVAQLPPPLVGYEHLDDALYINRQREIIANPSSEVVSGDQLRARLDYLLRYAWKPGNTFLRSLADHAPINYVTAMAAAMSNS